MEHKVDITSGFLLLLIAVTVLAGPGRTLIVLLAAAVHELGHLAALRLFGARAEGIALGSSGARIVFTGALSYPQEAAAALAGPLAGGLLSGFALWAGRRWGSDPLMELAAVSALYTLANLVPAGPTDGGRALEAVLSSRFGPDRAYFIGAAVDALCVLAALTGGLCALFGAGGPSLLIYAYFLLIGCCKTRGFGVKSKGEPVHQ